MAVRKTVLRKVGEAIRDHSMIRDGDTVAVGVSGGKDSITLLSVLEELRRKAPISFTLRAFTVEQGKFVRPVEALGEALRERGFDWTYFRDEPSFRLLDDEPDHGCEQCSRYRRRAVYQIAAELDANVVALGHTADDLCEALLRNALFTGRLASLPGVATSSSGRFRVIRPLIYVNEELTAAVAAETGMPVTPCVCSHRTGTVRGRLRSFLEELRGENQHVTDNLIAAMGRIDTHRLLDRRFHGPHPEAPGEAPELLPVLAADAL